MKLRIILIALILLAALFSFGYAETVTLTGLVDRFQQATDLERQTLINDYFGKETSGSGVVANVEEYNFFNEKDDAVYQYYRVTTQTQKTANNTAYQLIFLSKDLEKVKAITRGQNITKEGKLIKLLDERLQISIWLYDSEPTPLEKGLFQQ